ncbi:MAG: hypothetical protein K1X55_15400 [Chitinophagales bacterium]|nr:hypothetical protein [Chitinophagales bacterium]
MHQHEITRLVLKIEHQYSKEVKKYLLNSKKSRTAQLYKLIISAKNQEQLEKGLIFKKLFTKSYSEKTDYLWRNEIRLLKEELEIFLIQMEHEHFSKNNQAYNDWLLMHAFDKLKYMDGLDEKYDVLIKDKDTYASYSFVLDACMLHLSNLTHKFSDITKRSKAYPEPIEATKMVLKDVVSANAARLNVYISYFNWISYHHQYKEREPLILNEYNFILEKNPISNFYNHLAGSVTDSSEKSHQTQIENLDAALQDIEPLYKKNKLLLENRVIVLMAKGREQSANGYFLEADTIFRSIKEDIDNLYPQHRTVFYVNYITNLVKYKMYKEALYVLEHEFTTDNLLYKNMLLQSRLLCYLYLRDTRNLADYISYDLDTAPFPQNYMLKVIKSAYFYLIKEYETAISINNSLLHAKYTTDNLLYYKPISLIYKKLYAIAQKNSIQKKIVPSDLKILKDAVDEFERTSSNEIKLVSVYLWIKQEIEGLLK